MRRRLDTEIVRRGLAGDLDEARTAVDSGRVLVGGATAVSPSSMVAADVAIVVAAPARAGFVSRGGDKLAAALDRFGVDPDRLEALDAGASTGGFTDCLLRRGAARVVAIDVGYGDLAWSLRTDARVHLFERTNLRDVSSGDLPFRPELVVADLSFVSLAGLVPTLVELGTADASFVVLVKPQFEAPQAEVGDGGVVGDPRVWRMTIDRVADAFLRLGVQPRQVMASPVRGRSGNVEYLLHAGRTASSRAGALDVDSAIEEGHTLAGGEAS